jgi:hypothetical protein
MGRSVHNRDTFNILASSSLLLASSVLLILDDSELTISYDPTKPPSVIYGTGSDAIKVPCNLVTDPEKVKEGYHSFACPPPPTPPVQETKTNANLPTASYGTGSDIINMPCTQVTDPAKQKEGYTSYTCAPLPAASQANGKIKPPSLS